MKEFSDLVGRIYDAALTPDLWNDVLARVRAYVHTETAAFNSYDAYDKSSFSWQYMSGYNPEYLQIYIEKYLAMNPWIGMVAALGSGETAFASAQSIYQDTLRSEFYHGWMAPQRFVDAAVLIVDKAIGATTTIVTVRTDSQGLFDTESVERLALLYPHVRRAAAIGRIVSAAEAQATTLASALDVLSAGVFLLSDTGRIVHSNRSGAEMLSSGAPVCSKRARLEFTSDGDRVSQRPALGDPIRAAAAATVPLNAADGRQFMAHIMPLDPSRRIALAADRAAAFIVLIKETRLMTATAVAAAARLYGLTAQEARVLRMVVDAGGTPLAAEALKISAATVRTHIARIFDKTEVRSQGALIKLLSEMGAPLRPAG